MSVVVYKVGGSLLSLPDLSQRLRAVLEQPLPFATLGAQDERIDPLLIVGGGPVADAVRDWDQRHKLGDQAAHELALRSMSFNAHLVGSVLTNATVVTNRAEARTAWADGNVAVLASAEFVDLEERETHDLLPRSWDVTSDSIAAYVALHWPATALVFLKSVALPEEFDLQTTAQHGLVDRHLPALAARIPAIGWCDLRAQQPIIRQWLATKCKKFWA